LAGLVVGAVILGVGFFVTRGPGQDTPGGSTTTTEAEIDSDVTLACVEAIAPACKGAAAVLGVAMTTWAPGSPVPERGVVVAPVGDLPDGSSPTVVAESPIVIAFWRTRLDPLVLSCDESVDAACVAGALGRQWSELNGAADWGPFKLGLADATAGEPALLAWSLLQPALGSADVAGGLRLRSGSDASLMKDMVLFGDSRADLVITTEVAVAGQFENALSRDGRIEVSYPSQGPWVEYGAIGEGRGNGRLIEELASQAVAEAFTAAGLRPAAGPAGELPEPLGEAGTKTPPPDDATRGTLISTWEDRT
jgi:hypothetical protein